jgi:hypothetical protein
MASKPPSLLRRLLLLPLLAPLLGCLAVAAINPRPVISLRFLTWRTPALPLGVWIAAAAGAGAGLSGLATALALQEGVRPPTRRRVPIDPGAPRRRTPPRRDPSPAAEPAAGAAPGPARSAADPPPTVSVPFRVIQRGGPAQRAGAAPTSTPSAAAAPSADDDWSVPPTEDW